MKSLAPDWGLLPWRQAGVWFGPCGSPALVIGDHPFRTRGAQLEERVHCQLSCSAGECACLCGHSATHYKIRCTRRGSPTRTSRATSIPRSRAARYLGFALVSDVLNSSARLFSLSACSENPTHKSRCNEMRRCPLNGSARLDGLKRLEVLNLVRAGSMVYHVAT